MGILAGDSRFDDLGGERLGESPGTKLALHCVLHCSPQAFAVHIYGQHKPLAASICLLLAAESSFTCRALDKHPHSPEGSHLQLL